MKTLRCPLLFAGVLISSFVSTAATGRFDQRLTPDKQVIHVLNRLTFGPRPGDVEQVRRMTIQRWIEQQLHPEQITENPSLAGKLEPLGTVKLAMWQILEDYPAAPKALMLRPASASILSTLPPLQVGKLMTGSLDDRRAALAGLDPEKRRLVLAAIPPQALELLPDDLRKEGEQARQSEQDALQKERRRL